MSVHAAGVGWHHHEICGLSGGQTSGLFIPAQRFRARQGGHAHESLAGHFGIVLVQPPRLGQDIQVRIGSQAIGAEGNSHTGSP